jgi:hypothetical protein
VVVQERSERVAMFRARVAVLFERLPMLCGFHVTGDLGVVEVAVHDWPGSTLPGDFHGVLCALLEDLIEDCAEDAVDLLRGTTFARAVH